MNTIKCSKCGCEMSAMSEACPLCGTPTNNECSNEEKTNSSFEKAKLPNIPKLTLTGDEVCQSLEEALMMAIGHRMQNPHEIVYIFPLDTDTPIMSFFDQGGFIIGSMDVSNAPIVYADGENTELKSIEDCKHYISSYKERFVNEGITNVEVGYNFIVMNVWESPQSQNVLQVDIKLVSDSMGLTDMVNKFNQIDKEAGGCLVLDVKNSTLKGSVKTFPVKGGIFEKKRIKKSNESIVSAFYTLMRKVSEYL